MTRVLRVESDKEKQIALLKIDFLQLWNFFTLFHLNGYKDGEIDTLPDKYRRNGEFTMKERIIDFKRQGACYLTYRFLQVTIKKAGRKVRFIHAQKPWIISVKFVRYRVNTEMIEEMIKFSQKFPIVFRKTDDENMFIIHLRS